MSDARHPTPPLDDLLDAALARTVRRVARADLRARVMASVGHGHPRTARPLAIWTAVAAAAVVTVVIAAHTMRSPVEPSARTANEAPANARSTLRSAEPAPTSAAARRVAASGTARPAASIPSRAHGPHLAPGDLQVEADAPPPLRIDALEHPPSPIVPLHTDELVIAPLVIEDAGSFSSEDRP